MHVYKTCIPFVLFKNYHNFNVYDGKDDCSNLKPYTITSIILIVYDPYGIVIYCFHSLLHFDFKFITTAHISISFLDISISNTKGS